MSGRCRVEADETQLAALRGLSRSERRDEADRARAMLLSREGWTCAEIGAGFGVTADQVRHWRSGYARGGVGALRVAGVPGTSGARGWGEIGKAARRERVVLLG